MIILFAWFVVSLPWFFTSRAPDKLLCQLDIYETWLSLIAYLQNKLRIFFTLRFCGYK